MAASTPSSSSANAESINAGVINQGKWTDLEEQLFIEGLELYGRGWEDVSDMPTNHLAVLFCLLLNGFSVGQACRDAVER